jgi:hypothetical protein
LTLDPAGLVLGLLPYLREARNYFKGRSEDKELKGKTIEVLPSIENVAAAIDAIKKSHDDWVETVEKSPMEIGSKEAEAFLKTLTDAYNSISDLIEGLVSLARECKAIPKEDTFMRRLAKRKPAVHDVIIFAADMLGEDGKISLDNLPTFLKLHDKSFGSLDDLANVAESEEEIARERLAIQKERSMKLRLGEAPRDRKAATRFVESIFRLGKEAGKISINGEAEAKLKQTESPWFEELARLAATAGEELNKYARRYKRTSKYQ